MVRRLALAGAVAIVPFASILAVGCGPAHSSSSRGAVSTAAAANATVDLTTVLGSAASFSVLAGTTVTNTGPTTITGSVGVSPGTAITGFPPATITNGTIHLADAVALQAQSDVTTAYDALMSAPSTADMTGKDLGGLTLTPGVYTFSSSAQLTGTLVLDDQGNSKAVFIFQIGSTLTTASNSSVHMATPGLCGRGVFWQVGSSATLGTGTTFEGSILALTSITLQTGARLTLGRALARNGSVTLDSNDIEVPTQ
jgi:type VI secretion system secreted protein VgrG